MRRLDPNIDQQVWFPISWNLGADMKFQKISLTVLALFVAPLVIGNKSQAATINVEACLSATILEQTPDINVLGIGQEFCTSIQVVANAELPGENITVTDGDTQFGALWGGGNTTDTPVNFVIQYDWTVEVSIDLINPDDHAVALIIFSFESYEFSMNTSVSDSLIFSGTIDPWFAVDGFEFIAVEATVLSYIPVPVPSMIVPLLMSIALLGTRNIGSSGGCRFKV